MTRLTKWAATTALVLTAGLGLTACSDDDETSDGSTAPGEDSSDVRPVSDTLTQEDFAERVAAAQLEAGSVHVSMDTGASGTVEGDVQLGEDVASTSMAMTMGDVEVVMVEGVLYLNLGQTSGGQFVRVDPSAGGPFASFEGLIDTADPTAQVNAFATAMKGFEATDETEEIDGVETRAYVLTVDPSQTLTEDQLALTGGQVPESMEVTMYIDDDDLPRRVVTDVMGQQLVVEFSGWGDEVDIQAPPADQVVDGAQFGL